MANDRYYGQWYHYNHTLDTRGICNSFTDTWIRKNYLFRLVVVKLRLIWLGGYGSTCGTSMR
jgi:hypothetical protein